MSLPSWLWTGDLSPLHVSSLCHIAVSLAAAIVVSTFHKHKLPYGAAHVGVGFADLYQLPFDNDNGAVLCCAVLCCAVLCCAVLCCAVLCCAVPPIMAVEKQQSEHWCSSTICLMSKHGTAQLGWFLHDLTEHWQQWLCVEYSSATSHSSFRALLPPLVTVLGIPYLHAMPSRC